MLNKRTIHSIFLISLILNVAVIAAEWTETSFEDFADGIYSDGGTNIYTTADGKIKIIGQQLDVNGDGYMDIVFSNDSNAEFSYIYWGSASGFSSEDRTELPTHVLRATNVGSEMSGAYWESNITDDRIRIAFARIKPSEGGSTNLFYIKFDVLANRPGATAEIGFDHVQLAESLSIATHNGSITVLPDKSALLPNYPNPFNPETWIPFHLAETADVSISIYDVGGKLIRLFHLGEILAGVYADKAHAVYWDGRNVAGEKVSSGVYFYHLEAGDYSATRRMLILK